MGVRPRWRIGAPAEEQTCLGVEHELRLWRGPDQVDFRTLVAEVAAGIRPMDPGDPRARRLPSGVALTADGREAELATPPVPVGSRAPELVDQLLRAERTELRDRVVEHGVTAVTGYSTHLNVSVPDHEVVAVGRAVVQGCVVALAAVVEPAASHGLLVRPRRGRLEVGGEYVEGPDLVAGLTLLAACVRAVRSGATAPGPEPAGTTASREKYGWFVPPQRGTARHALEDVWAWARPWALAEGLDPAPLDHLVDGVRPLRPRTAADPAACTFGPPQPIDPVAAQLGPRLLAGGLRAETEWLTWQHVVWVFRDQRDRECRAVVPAWRETEFLRGLDAGEHDRVLARMLRRPLRPRRLLTHAQIGRGGFWHDVRPGALVPAERGPDGTVPRVSVRAARRAHLGRARADRREESR